MHMSYGPAASIERKYRQIGIRHDIASASPHRLIQMMMERVLTKIALAREHMVQENVAEKGRLIGDAINIISGLQASLNYDADTNLSGNFDALYGYMNRRLTESNLRNDPQGLLEVAGLMTELKSAWDAIADQVTDPESAPRS